MKKLQISPPEGYEIDQDKSDLSKGVVCFKEVKNKLTYKDVYLRLFYTSSKDHFDLDREIKKIVYSSYWDKENIDGRLNLVSSSKEQLESIIALNQLVNVAKYLNGDWLPNWDSKENKYYIYYNCSRRKVNIGSSVTFKNSMVYFKYEELAQQAIDILTEPIIRKALTLNH